MARIGEQRQRACHKAANYFYEHEDENDDKGPANTSLVVYRSTMAVAVATSMAVVVITPVLVVVMIVARRGVWIRPFEIVDFQGQKLLRL